MYSKEMAEQSLLLAVARQGLIFIPLIYILPIFIGSNGILSAQLAADILTFILSGTMFYSFIKGNKLDISMSAGNFRESKT